MGFSMVTSTGGQRPRPGRHAGLLEHQRGHLRRHRRRGPERLAQLDITVIPGITGDARPGRGRLPGREARALTPRPCATTTTRGLFTLAADMETMAAAGGVIEGWMS